MSNNEYWYSDERFFYKSSTLPPYLFNSYNIAYDKSITTDSTWSINETHYWINNRMGTIWTWETNIQERGYSRMIHEEISHHSLQVAEKIGPVSNYSSFNYALGYSYTDQSLCGALINNLSYGRPTRPTGFTAQDLADNISLSWNQNPESNLLRYRIYMGKTEDNLYLIDSTTAADQNSIFIHKIHKQELSQKYYFAVTAVNNNVVESNKSQIISLEIMNLLLLPNNISNNYPNPFKSGTNISITVAERGTLKIVIYDIMGREIKTLFNAVINEGETKVHWDGKNRSFKEVGSGIYLYLLKFNNQTVIKRILKLK